MAQACVLHGTGLCTAWRRFVSVWWRCVSVWQRLIAAGDTLPHPAGKGIFSHVIPPRDTRDTPTE